MQKRILILVLPVLLLVGASVVLAQTPTFEPQPYIYRIKVEGCTHAPAIRRQTGFLVRGEGGIVTALHGVADCPNATIAAESAHGDFAALIIQAVDIDRDVALLSSPEVADRLAEGLDAPHTDRVARTGLHALGYPYGKTHQEPTTQITVTYAMTLNQVIPGEFITAAFEQRRSPDLETRVLMAEAHFVPGHSGAPVLNAQKQVIGVVSGGLKEGYIGKSWLIPWADIQWQPLYDKKGVLNPALKARWALVQENDPELSLSFLSTYPGQIASPAKAVTYRGRLVDQASRQGIAKAEVHLIFEEMGEVRFGASRAGGFFEFEVAPNAKRSQGLLWIRAENYNILEYPIYDLDVVTRLGTIPLELLPPTPTVIFKPTPTSQSTLTVPAQNTGTVNVTGIWQGYLTLGNSTPNYRYRLDLVQDGNVISGKSRVERLGFPDDFIEYTVVAQLIDEQGQMVLRVDEIQRGAYKHMLNFIPAHPSWAKAMRLYYLTRQSEEVLEGEWRDRPGATQTDQIDGTVQLIKQP